ncbi:ATP-grasp domain-containing protein [Nocardiopsis ansamitocini]|uniref:ATP-grasp domain-containing protein n=1 Tax=Nocardiopsis ansamitocini TaxID=1670832 RepID=A0A9W6P7Q3_9ACTN|nr:hypothetical protein [Nocardiopsis ansamitocini]GLU48561.1 ATP-grasp domain-containing protein [Nocardiopsis ansamitocini]
MPDLILASARRLPRPVPETDLLVAALDAVGLSAQVRAWDEPLDWAEIPLVVVRTPWDYAGRHGEFLQWTRHVAEVSRLLNPAPLIEWNSHKGYLVELADKGAAVLPTALVRRDASPGRQAEALRASGTGEVVIKPAVGVGGHGALRSPADDPRAADHLAALTREGDALIQPFAPSVLADGEISLLYFGGRFSHAVRKVPASGEYRVHEHHGGSVLDHTPDSQERAVAEQALGLAPETTGYARVDLVRTASGPAVMELELIEPELFLTRDAGAASRFAEVLAGHAGARR